MDVNDFAYERLKRSVDYLDPTALKKLDTAYQLAKKAHQNQKRRSGEDYIQHPIAVAEILAKLHININGLLAALLHDVLEDTSVTSDTLTQTFNPCVTQLVEGVTKITQIEFSSDTESQAENFKKMLLAMSKDIRVIIIKLADRLHNMRTISAMSHRKQVIKSRETLDIFAPIAHRLGMHLFSMELENLSFEVLYPLRYRILKGALDKVRGNHRQVIDHIIGKFTQEFEERKVDFVEMSGREKHIYSLYKKMKIKQLTFSEITDVYAMRIVCHTTDACYRILGIVHGTYKPVFEKIKDYIAVPKMNGYQSIHTVLIGPYGLPIEVQIRTQKMHQMANTGISAHWFYKSNNNDSTQPGHPKWVENLIDIEISSENPQEFIENVKMDLFPHETYVFTPKGAIVQLPVGSTVLDFAFHIHTQVGLHCIAAKVNRQLCPISTKLKNGETVEIITNSNSTPNNEWLKHVITAKARTCLQHYFNSIKESSLSNLGKLLINRHLRQSGLQLDTMDDETIDNVLKKLRLPSIETLLQEIALGKLDPLLATYHFVVGSHAEYNPADDQEPLTISGTEGMSIQYADCCLPIPGDNIIGIFEFGENITVHRDECKHAKDSLTPQQGQLINVAWEKNTDHVFATQIQVIIVNKKGSLASLALAMADADINIRDISVNNTAIGNFKKLLLTLEVRSRSHLGKVLRLIRKSKLVDHVSRI